MKNLCLLLLCSCFFLSSSFGQKKANLDLQSQNSDDPFAYRVLGLVYVSKFDAATKTKLSDQKIITQGLIFNIVAEESDSSDNSIYYVIQFPPITDITPTTSSQLSSLKGNSIFINSDDNDDYHWMRKDALDQYLEDGFIRKSFQTFKARMTYGGHVSLPFKLRPKVDTLNIKINSDITLGGYLGAKYRINQYKPFYLSFPVVTLGLATLDFTDDNTPNSPNVGDGKVLGITGSWGGIFQLADFQFGFLMGWDRAAGQIGKDWIYNNKPWYSFSVGYTFVGDDPSKQPSGGN